MYPCVPACLQALLSQWEEKVARQLELISELQSPTQRNSMMAVSAASARDSAAGLRPSRLASFTGPLQPPQASMGALRASLSEQQVGGQQAVGAAPLSRSSTINSAAGGGLPPTGGAYGAYSRDAAASSMLLQSTGFGSSFSSASFAGGLGGGMSASAPNSPQLWDKAGGRNTLVGEGGVPRRSAFTPGPALNGMGDASPGGGDTPR